MTGLDATRDVIVEIATLITDDELNIVAEGPDLVIHATEEQLAGMDQVVVDMHTSQRAARGDPCVHDHAWPRPAPPRWSS